MFRCMTLSLVALLAFAACGETPVLSPAEVTLAPGMIQPFHLSGLKLEDAVWTASGGSVQAHDDGALYTAPAAEGSYTVTVSHRGDPARSSSAVVTVQLPAPAALELDAPPAAGGVAGRYGAIAFEALPGEGAAARARFHDPVSGAEVEVVLDDADHGTVNVDGVEIDGRGRLTAEEETALRALFSGEGGAALVSALVMAPLDLACDESARDIDQGAAAALLLPSQLALKYLVPGRMVMMQGAAAASRCRYFTDPAAETVDTRPSSLLFTLSNGKALPTAFGYFPFDDVGEVEETVAAATGALAQGLEADENVFGPGRSMCRGACGSDCAPNNCGEPEEEWRCEQEGGKNTGRKQLWRSYTCGEHEGCVEHDGCFDSCNAAFGVHTVDAFFCMRGCDMQAGLGHGAVQGVDWALGFGPFENEQTYDYSVGDPVEDLAMCPPNLSLSATPSSGMAPLATTLRWEGLELDGGPYTCTLDPGDGSPPYVIPACGASGEQAHDYRAPSELRAAAGVYTATLQVDGEPLVATTDVDVGWRFEATPTSGPEPLPVDFRWEGLDPSGPTLTCTLDYGDGSAPDTVADCAGTTAAAHTYSTPGTYVVEISVSGEQRPSAKTLVVEVQPSGELSGSATARFEGTYRCAAAPCLDGDVSRDSLMVVEVSGIDFALWEDSSDPEAYLTYKPASATVTVTGEYHRELEDGTVCDKTWEAGPVVLAHQEVPTVGPMLYGSVTWTLPLYSPPRDGYYHGTMMAFLDVPWVEECTCNDPPCITNGTEPLPIEVSTWFDIPMVLPPAAPEYVLNAGEPMQGTRTVTQTSPGNELSYTSTYTWDFTLGN